MGRLLDNPWTVIILIVLVVLLFGAAKLPGLARNLGQSMRIFKSEVKQMKDDGKSDPKSSDGKESPVEGRVVDGSHANSSKTPSGQPDSTGAQDKSPDNTP